MSPIRVGCCACFATDRKESEPPITDRSCALRRRTGMEKLALPKVCAWLSLQLISVWCDRAHSPAIRTMVRAMRRRARHRGAECVTKFTVTLQLLFDGFRFAGSFFRCLAFIGVTKATKRRCCCCCCVCERLMRRSSRTKPSSPERSGPATFLGWLRKERVTLRKRMVPDECAYACVCGTDGFLGVCLLHAEVKGSGQYLRTATQQIKAKEQF